MTVICVYHGGCVDGLAAAHTLQKKYPDARLIACAAGNDPDFGVCVYNTEVFFVDISPSVSFLKGLLGAGNTVTVLDHHVSAFAGLSEVQTSDKFHYIYQSDACGCLITHRYLFPETPTPWYMVYIDDNDRWVHQQPNTAEINSAIQSEYRSIKGMSELESADPHDLLEKGKFLNSVREKNVADSIATRIECEYSDPKDPKKRVLKCYLYSDFAYTRSLTGSRLMDLRMLNGDLPDFVAFYRYDLRTDNIFVSLRGRDTGIDCCEIAERFGGGGHRNACGFEFSTFQPLNTIFVPTGIP